MKSGAAGHKIYRDANLYPGSANKTQGIIIFACFATLRIRSLFLEVDYADWICQ